MGPHYKLEIKVLEKFLIPVTFLALDSEFCNWKYFLETLEDNYSKSDSWKMPRLFPNKEASLTYISN